MASATRVCYLCRACLQLQTDPIIFSASAVKNQWGIQDESAIGKSC